MHLSEIFNKSMIIDSSALENEVPKVLGGVHQCSEVISSKLRTVREIQTLHVLVQQGELADLFYRKDLALSQIQVMDLRESNPSGSLVQRSQLQSFKCIQITIEETLS
mmetsp:Transcript_8205/g.19804  ORF Transcript_8205/g.19804 Transcript_8205/m.19804 type:complete len:108 (-) Transcript_8205:301-624(-)